MEEKLKEKIFKSLSQTIKDSFTTQKVSYDETNHKSVPTYKNIDYNISFKIIVPYEDNSAEIATDEVLNYIKDRRHELIKEYYAKLKNENK